MKLKNKKTGEIVTFDDRNFISSKDYGFAVYLSDGDKNSSATKYNSLAEFNDEWEDYEKPKEYWYLDSAGNTLQDNFDDDWVDERRKQIGNKFETEEEAERAVRKLRAWQRLKDDGITFRLDKDSGKPYIVIHSKEERGSDEKVLRVLEDIGFLFGEDD